MIVGLDLRLASPALRRAVTVDAARECPATAPILRSVVLRLRRGPSTPEALRGHPLDLKVWGLDLGADLPLTVALDHRPEGVAPSQLGMGAAAPEDMLRLATGWVLWVRCEGDVLRPRRRPPTRPGGSPVALRRAA